MKITKSELMQIIKEEVEAYKKVKLLESRKAEILRQLNEMDETMMEAKICSECGRPMEENSMEEGILQKAGQAIQKAIGIMPAAEKKEYMMQILADKRFNYPDKIKQAAQASGKPEAEMKKELMDTIMSNNYAIDKFGKAPTEYWSVAKGGKPVTLFWTEVDGWSPAGKLQSTQSYMMREEKKNK